MIDFVAGSKRTLLFGLVLALSFGLGVDAQLPPITQGAEIEENVERLALEQADELLMWAKGNVTGLLHPDGDLAFRRLSEAVRLWKKEKGAGAAPLLAEGVLFDCLGRLQGVKTSPLRSELENAPFTDVAALRLERATKAYEAALKIDSELIEARMRVARIRALDDAQAALELEKIAEGQTGSPFAYLAAISRAEVARAQDDVVGAIRWYERALGLYPRSTAATIALSSLKPATALSFDALDPNDLYYTYPCSVLTGNVGVALSERVRNVVVK